jgi:chromosome partitioning protein
METEKVIGKFFISQNELAELLQITPQAMSISAKQKGIESFKDGNKAVFPSSGVRSLLESRGLSYPIHKIIAFQMLKGGSTKTSTAFNLAVRLNHYGSKVLALDLDPQGNLTDSFGVDVTDQPVAYHVVSGQCKIEDTVIRISDGIDLIPSDFDNSSLDFLISSKNRDLRNFISSMIDPIKSKYDFIIIDCNPSLSPINISIALASDQIIIPVNPDKFSYKGLKKMLDEYDRIGNDYKKNIDYKLLFTLYDGREQTSQKYLIDYGSLYQGKLFNTVIKRNSDVKNALDQKKTIFDFKKAPAREDFDLLAKEVLNVKDFMKKKTID